MRRSKPTESVTGQDALARGAWTEALDAFTSALAIRETPEALEGLALAAWWLDLSAVVFESRERGYQLFLDKGDQRSASRLAVWLAWDYWAFRGESAVANGWLKRARRLLDGEGDCAERAWLECREGAMILLEEGDPDRGASHADEAVRAARAAGSVDFEMLGRAVHGMALVVSGAVSAGMSEIDEVNAAVVAREIVDPVVVGVACCYMIAACDRVRDYDRALQWCTRLKAHCMKWGLRPLFAVCPHPIRIDLHVAGHMARG